MHTGVRGRLLPLLYLSFFVSGTAGLMYEVVWMRLLSLSFGSMVFAVGAVLSSFMAGMAVGSFILGKVSDRWGRPLLAYALLEAAVAVTALFTPELIGIVGRVSPSYGTGPGAFLAQASLTFALSFAVLIVPTALMGGTLPVLSRALVARQEEVAGKVGRLYSANTFGGVTGVVLAGMILLPLIGMRNTVLLAAALNLIIALSVGALTFRIRSPTRAVAGSTDIGEPDTTHPPGSILLLAIALSGLASMIYEVSWTRSLTLVIGSSIYAFSTMLLSFIFGIALGSFLFTCFVRRRSPSLHVFSYVEVGIAVASIIVVFSFDRLPSLFLRMYGALEPDLGLLLIGELFISFLVMLVPAVLFGMTLPMVAHIFARGKRGIGRAIGFVYGANTLGCILGSTGASFLFIPILGLETTLRTAVVVNLVAALLAFIYGRGKTVSRYAFSFACLACLAVTFAVPKEWNKRVMSVGVAPNAVWLEKLAKLGDLEMIASLPELLYYRDGLSATVAVKKDKRDMSMSIDGKTDASAVGDLPTELLVGYLPLFIHPDPDTVMVLGLGSGISLAATLSFGVDRAECLEIEPAVVEASRFFSQANRNIHENPRARILLADGRHHLLSTGTRYDVITSEPSNPWMAGISSLFTREFYEICASRLRGGGVMCQFIHGYNLTPEDFKMVMRTFSSVFPHKQLWSSAFGLDYLMIGSLDTIRLDTGKIRTRMENEEVLSDLSRIGIAEPRDLLAHFLLEGDTWDGLTAGASLNADDLPLLEYSAPKSLYVRTDIIRTELGQTIHAPDIRTPQGMSWEAPEKASIHTRRGDLFLEHDFSGYAVREYTTAVTLRPEWHVPYLKRGETYLMTVDGGSALGLTSAARDLEKALSLEPNSAEIHSSMARLAQLQGRPEQAAGYLRTAAELEPRAEYYGGLVDILVDDLKMYSEAERLVDEALSVVGEKTSLLERKGFIAEVTGRHITAAQYYRAAIEADSYSRAHYRLGRLLLKLEQPARAVKPLEQAVRLGPTFAETHIALARAYAGTGRRREAIRSYKNALRIDPHNGDARAGLSSLQ